MPHARAAEAVGLAMSVQPHVGVGMSDALGRGGLAQDGRGGDNAGVKLPNAELAVIDAAKVRDYLLSESHPVGRFKAEFFRALGFRPERWQDLELALRKHAMQHEALPGDRSEYGTKYEVTGVLSGPEGRTAEVLVAWIVPTGENVPRLITAQPARKRP